MSRGWTQATIASVIEGHGESAALPKVLFRIAAELNVPLLTPKDPLRRHRSELIAPRGIEKAVNAKASEVRDRGGVLVLIDADDDCPAQLGPELLARARKAREDKRVTVVLAKREFEAWYLAAAPSIAGQHGFPEGLRRPGNPEGPRDCKGWLSRARGGKPKYSPTVDQAPLASVFDMGMAREYSPSFDKFYREVAWLLGVSLPGATAG
jgi:hypothetical protein